MSDRKAELERKKEKLRLIREEKERRRKERELLDQQAAVEKLSSSRGGSAVDNLDQRLRDMGINPVDDLVNKLISNDNDRVLVNGGANGVDGPSLADDKMCATPSSLVECEDPVIGSARIALPPKRRAVLSLAPVQQINIEPVMTGEMYCKSTQTVESMADSMTMSTTKIGDTPRPRASGGGAIQDCSRPHHDYYMFAFDDADEYEEDSLPGLHGSSSPTSSSSPVPHSRRRASKSLNRHSIAAGNDALAVHFVPIPSIESTNSEGGDSKFKDSPDKTFKDELPRTLPDSEIQSIVNSDIFTRFFARAATLVERVICEEPTDVFVDYCHATNSRRGSLESPTFSHCTSNGKDAAEYDDEDDDEDDLRINKSSTLFAGAESPSHRQSNPRSSVPSSRSSLMSLNRTFYDDRWCRNRVVTSLSWSPVYTELMLASFDKNPESTVDPDGLCLVWNSKFRKKNTPEQVFNCQSAVLTAQFAPFSPNLIVGGTYSGQLVVWDNRVAKRTPIQRTPLSSSAHTHPVYCVRVVGSANAHNLISISTDGRVCTWSLDMLHGQPTEMMELHQPKQNRPVAVTALDFPEADVNNFLVGSEDGSVYSACRHGTQTGVTDVYVGHSAPVTGLDVHPLGSNTDTLFSPSSNSNDIGRCHDLGHLFLTSSMDWSVKLWSMQRYHHQTTPRDSSAASAAVAANVQHAPSSPSPASKLIHSFDDAATDYVYDVRWSPVHPALFATGYGSGRLSIWSLIDSSTEEGTHSQSQTLSTAGGLQAPVTSVHLDSAVNRISWNRQTGLQLAAGDHQGKISLFDINSRLAVPRSVASVSALTAQIVDSLVSSSSTQHHSQTARLPSFHSTGQAGNISSSSSSNNNNTLANNINVNSMNSSATSSLVGGSGSVGQSGRLSTSNLMRLTGSSGPSSLNSLQHLISR